MTTKDKIYRCEIPLGPPCSEAIRCQSECHRYIQPAREQKVCMRSTRPARFDSGPLEHQKAFCLRAVSHLHDLRHFSLQCKSRV